MSKIFQFQTIQFSISIPLVLCNPYQCYHARPEWTWEQWQWRCALHSPKPQHHWNITIRLFSVMTGHSLGGWGSYLSAEVQSVYSTALADWVSVLSLMIFIILISSRLILVLFFVLFSLICPAKIGVHLIHRQIRYM